MADFESSYHTWLESHLSRRNGERLRRLKAGHGFGEKLLVENVWWPAIGNFDGLHPEYEVFDYKDGSRFLDLAFIKDTVRIDLENMGFGPHIRHASREKFKDDQRRHRHLVVDGWIAFHYAHDEILDNPRACQQELLHLMGRLFSGTTKSNPLVSAYERDVLRFAARKGSPVSPKEIMTELRQSYYIVRSIIQQLINKNLLHPSSGNERITSYTLDKEAYRFLF